MEEKFAYWKQKLTLKTMFPIWQNWKMLGKDARAMNVSGNTLPCFTEADTDKNSLQKVLIKAESNLA